MYLRFNDLLHCNQCIQELGDRMGLNANVTARYANAREDIEGKYVIPKPKQSLINKLEYLVRPITIDSLDEEGNPIQVDSIEKVQKVYDEEGNDVTEYDGTEYVLTKQTNLYDEFTYEEVESVEYPVIEEV